MDARETHEPDDEQRELDRARARRLLLALAIGGFVLFVVLFALVVIVVRLQNERRAARDVAVTCVQAPGTPVRTR